MLFRNYEKISNQDKALETIEELLQYNSSN